MINLILVLTLMIYMRIIKITLLLIHSVFLKILNSNLIMDCIFCYCCLIFYFVMVDLCNYSINLIAVNDFFIILIIIHLLMSFQIYEHRFDMISMGSIQCILMISSLIRLLVLLGLDFDCYLYLNFYCLLKLLMDSFVDLTILYLFLILLLVEAEAELMVIFGFQITLILVMKVIYLMQDQLYCYLNLD